MPGCGTSACHGHGQKKKKKKKRYVYTILQFIKYVMAYSRNYHSIVNQLHFNKTLKMKQKLGNSLCLKKYTNFKEKNTFLLKLLAII